MRSQPKYIALKLCFFSRFAVVRVTSPELNKLNVTGLNFFNGSDFNDVGLDLVTYKTHYESQLVDIDLSNFWLRGGVNNYLYIEIDHAVQLPKDVWTFVSIFHPSKA